MPDKNLNVWKTVSVETILNHNKFLRVENHVVQLPDGQIIPDWSWVIIPDSVIVLAVSADDKFMCFRQTKYAMQGTSLAPVAGMLESNETPLQAAKRELLEEMGCEASELISLGGYILDSNRGIATTHLFLALNAKKVAEPNCDDLEEQEFVLLNKDEIETALKAGEFKILPWVATVSMSLNYLNRSFATLPKETGTM